MAAIRIVAKQYTTKGRFALGWQNGWWQVSADDFKAMVPKAYYRGVETRNLLRLRDQLFHEMMNSYVDEAADYVIWYQFRRH